MKWLAPSGVLGLHPLAAIGPVSVGPGPIEHSSALLPDVRISMDPVQSLVQRQVVLKIHIPAAQVGHSLQSRPVRLKQPFRWRRATATALAAFALSARAYPSATRQGLSSAPCCRWILCSWITIPGLAIQMTPYRLQGMCCPAQCR